LAWRRSGAEQFLGAMMTKHMLPVSTKSFLEAMPISFKVQPKEQMSCQIFIVTFD